MDISSDGQGFFASDMGVGVASFHAFTKLGFIWIVDFYEMSRVLLTLCNYVLLFWDITYVPTVQVLFGM